MVKYTFFHFSIFSSFEITHKTEVYQIRYTGIERSEEWHNE